MFRIPQWTLLVILAALLACGGQAPTPGEAVATIPASAGAATSAPSPVTPAPEPTETPQAVPTATQRPSAATTALPANSPGTGCHVRADTCTQGRAPEQSDHPPDDGTTPEDPGPPNFRSPKPPALQAPPTPKGWAEYSTARRSRPAEELNAILGCLQDETLLRLLLSGFVQDPAPLSMETSACIRTGFDGIDLRSAMLAATLSNEQNDMMVASVFGTIACLNDEEWETAATALGVDLGARAAMMCLLEEMGGTAGLTAALEPGAEESFTALILAVTDCDLEMEGGTEPATTPTPGFSPDQDPSAHRRRSPRRTSPTTTETTGGTGPMDADGDCQDARQEVLIEESLEPVTYETDRGMPGGDGTMVGAASGTPHRQPQPHRRRPPRAAQERPPDSGGWAWSPEMREEYANYLEDPENSPELRLSSRHNRSKGARGPEEWAPPDNALWCDYATDWAEIKERWGADHDPG